MTYEPDSSAGHGPRRGAAVTVLALAVICVATVWLLYRLDPVALFGLAHDDTLMMSSAKALAEGRGYIMPSVPETPRQTKYPVLYPWLLSLVWRWDPAFPSNLEAAIALVTAFVCLALVASYFLLRSLGLGKWPALGITAFCGLHPFFLFHSARVMTDMPGMAFIMCIAAVAQRTLRRERAYARMALLGLLTGTAMLMRSIAFTLLIPIAGVAVYRKQYRSTAVFLATSVPLVVLGKLLQGHNDPLDQWAAQGGPGFQQTWLYYTSYLGYWKLHASDWEVLWGMVWKNLFSTWLTIGNYFLLIPLHVPLLPEALGKLVHNALAVTLGVGVLAGIVRHARRQGWAIIHWTYLLHTGTIIAWTHGDLTDRFPIPFLPLFCLGAWTEGKHLGPVIVDTLRGKKPVWEKVIAAGLALVVAFLVLRMGAAYLYSSRVHLDTLRESRVDLQKERFELYEWVRNNTDAADRFVTRDDGELYLHTGRQGMWPIAFSRELYYADREEALDRDLDRILDTARHIRARYWVKSVDEFLWFSHRQDYLRRIDELFENQPVVFQSSGGLMRLYDVSALVERTEEREPTAEGGWPRRSRVDD